MSSTHNPGHFGHRQVDFANRPTRGKNKRTLILDALKEEVLCEEGLPFDTAEEAEEAYFRILVRRSLNVADKASGMLSKEILDRLCPTDKATLPAYKIEMREDGTAAEKIHDITTAVANGEVPPDVGNIMVNMITAAVKVEETVEMAERLARLEQMLADLDKE